MKLRLIGHDYKYAVEQIMLMMFPNERPEYEKESEIWGMSAESSLTHGRKYTQGRTVIEWGKKKTVGTARMQTDALGESYERTRNEQRLIKRSFYKAAIAITGEKPVWGALTGIRPGKLAAGLLERGESERSTTRILEKDYYVSPERAALAVCAAKSELKIKSAAREDDIALYIGIPFCPTRCTYCSFVSGSVEKTFNQIEPFLSTLHEEIKIVSKKVRELGMQVRTVYIGGGTPTTLSATELDDLMTALAKGFDLSEATEYTVEAGRPDTITPEKLSVMIDHGVSRISVNPQTMSGKVLRAIGRNHTEEDIYRAVAAVKGTGALTLNMDLIAGLPEDDLDGFKRSLEAVQEIAPENITVHTLSLKKGSRIMQDGTVLPDGATVSKMLDTSTEQLNSRGYRPYYIYRQKYTSGGYENTGWSQVGHECIYNVYMMEELKTVIAMGGGGVTKLVSPTGRIERVFNVKYAKEYIERREKLDQKVEQIESFYREEHEK